MKSYAVAIIVSKIAIRNVSIAIKSLFSKIFSLDIMKIWNLKMPFIQPS
jgi:hypothetical protein